MDYSPLYRRIHSVFLTLLASLLLSAQANAYVAPLVRAEKELPDVALLDEAGKPMAFAPDKSKLTLLHFWATWCVPCVKELPEVDALAAANPNMKIIAISLDGKNTEKVKAFYTEHQIKNLPIIFDDGMKSFRSLVPKGLPASIFIENGKEIARVNGVADWQSEEMKEFLRKAGSKK